MGSNNVKEATSGPRTGASSPRTQVEPQNGPNFEAVALGETAPAVANYAQPITVSILTPEEMSCLGPKPPERPFGELMQPIVVTDTGEVHAILTGIDPCHPLAEAISNDLARKLGRHQFTESECEAGTKFCFNGSSGAAWGGTCNLFKNLYALGFRSNPRGMHRAQVNLVALSDVVCQDLSAREHWSMPREPNELDCQRRKACIAKLMKHGYFEAAFILLSDFAKVDGRIIEDFAVPCARKLRDLRDFKTDDADPVGALKCGFAWGRITPLQAAKIVLRDVATMDNESTDFEHYQIQAFEEIAKMATIFDRQKLLEQLLDLPDIDRGDLFRNPKVRHLLLDVAKLEELRDVFDVIDNHYNAIFLIIRKRLEEKFVFHNDFLGAAKIEARSPYTPLAKKSIDQLLALAGAACVIGFEEEAVAVLEFLEQRNEDLSVEQRVALATLADQILMFARFSPDRQFRTSNFNAFKSRIDAILPPSEGGN